MKLLRRDGDEFEFEFAPVEKGLLFHLLGLYPAVPAAHHQLTKGRKIPSQAENQELLNEAVKSHRAENQRAVLALLNDAGRFTGGKEGARAVFQRGEVEWLLQVLNDVRVGHWIAAGSPNLQQEQKLQHDKQALRKVMLMELAGGFEMLFLGAVSGTLQPEADEP
jgi:hypothetical protein